jgi:hypothetical protein
LCIVFKSYLAAQLQHEVGFASRFYRAKVIPDRLQSIINQLGCSDLIQGQLLKEVLFILGELLDDSLWHSAKICRKHTVFVKEYQQA